ncbi:Chaperone protein DnaK, partial [Haemophilus influenzae]
LKVKKFNAILKLCLSKLLVPTMAMLG